MSIKLAQNLESNSQLQSRLSSSLVKSLSLREKYPDIFKGGSVSLMVQTKAIGDNAKGLHIHRQLPYKAWYKNNDATIMILSSKDYLSNNSNYTQAERVLITKQWKVDFKN